MGADAVVAYFGLRIPIESDSEVEALETRADDRLRRARRAKLDHWFGRATSGASYHLFVGRQIGVFGTEGASEISVTQDELSTICEETRRRLKDAGFEGLPALHIQLEAQY